MVQDNLANAIQQLLDFANGTASPQTVLAPIMQQLQGVGTAYSVKTPALTVKGRPDGPFQVNQPTILLGEPQQTTANAQTISQKDMQIFSYGQIVAFGSRVQQDGFVIIPYVPGAAFRVAPNNSSNAFVVNYDGTAGCSGNFTAPSYTNGNGFKNTIPVGAYWNTSYTASANVQLQQAVMNAANNAVGVTPFIWKFTHAGSITGMSMNQAGSTTGTNYLLIYKNGVNVYVWNAGVGTGNATFWAAFAKNAIAFAAGDTLTCFFQNTAAGNTQVSAHLTLELAA
jgi:hypothetical protein